MERSIDELIDDLGYIDTGVKYGISDVYILLDKESLSLSYFDTKEMTIYG